MREGDTEKKSKGIREMETESECSALITSKLTVTLRELREKATPTAYVIVHVKTLYGVA